MSKSDVSAVTKYFATANEGFSTTLGSTIASNAAIVPLNSVSGLVDTSVFVGIIEPGDATKQQVFTGTVDVANSRLTGCVWTRGSSPSGHAGGVTIVDYITGTAFNMFSAGILKQHKQSGAHAAVTADSLTTTGAITVGNGLTVSTGAVNFPSNSVGIAALSGTPIAFTPGGTTATNYVDVNGSVGHYMSLGGLKLAWGYVGLTYQAPAPSTAHINSVNMPSGFFSSTQYNSWTVQSEGNYANQHVSGDGINAFYIDGIGGNGTSQVSFLVIGT